MPASGTAGWNAARRMFEKPLQAPDESRVSFQNIPSTSM